MTEDALPYSKRKQLQERAGKPVVYQYGSFPQEFRIQVHYEIFSAIGGYDTRGLMGMPSFGPSEQVWDAVEDKLKREHGLLDLSPNDQRPNYKWRTHLLGLDDPNKVIDAIEAPLQYAVRAASQFGAKADKERNAAHVLRRVGEVNRRFREHDLGYEFVVAGDWGFVIRIDSQFVHAEVIEPAIATLYAAGFDGPLQEFAKAHQEYRRGNHKAATNEAHKAFESTMKAICSARGWQYDENLNATKLIKVILDNGLIPRENESFFNGLRTTLESGTPTLRNRRSAHGQGPNVLELPDYFAAFALHLAASTIVFLMAAHQALPVTPGAKQASS